MSDPFKNASIRQDKKKRRSNHRKYTPVVVWVKTDYESGNRLGSAEEMIRRKLREEANELMFVDALTDNEPYSKVLTEFDDEWEEDNID